MQSWKPECPVQSTFFEHSSVACETGGVWMSFGGGAVETVESMKNERTVKCNNKM